MGRTVETLDKLHRVQPPVVGDVKLILTSAIPDGWGVCDGGAVSRTGRSALYSLLGTTYGAGDGSTTFNLPDFRDRIPLGAGGAHLLHERSGADTATLTRAQMPGWPIHNPKASNALQTIAANTVYYLTTSEGSTTGSWAAAVFSTTVPPETTFIGPSLVPSQTVPLLRKNLAVNFIIFLGS